MWRKIPKNNRKKYYLIIFLFLPLCFVISFFLSKKIFLFLNFQFDLKGWVILSISLLPLYLMGIFVAHRALSGNENENQEGDQTI